MEELEALSLINKYSTYSKEEMIEKLTKDDAYKIMIFNLHMVKDRDSVLYPHVKEIDYRGALKENTKYVLTIVFSVLSIIISLVAILLNILTILKIL